MRVFRTCGARVRLAALIVPVLMVSANGQAAPMAAQRQQPPTPPTQPSSPSQPAPGQTQPKPAPGTAQPTTPTTPTTPAGQPPATPAGQPPTTPAGQPPAAPGTPAGQPPAAPATLPAGAPGPVPGQPSTVSQAPVSPPSDAPPVTEQRTSGPSIKLSLDDTVTRALEFNLDVQVQRINPRLQDLAVQGAQAVWNPAITNDTFKRDESDVPENPLFTGGISASTSTTTFQTTSGIQQSLPWFGSEYSLGWTNARRETTQLNQSFNPSLSSLLSFDARQPLLRNFLTDSNRTNLLVTRKQREITDVALQQTIVQTSRQVRNSYWELVYARANLSVAQQSLDLSRQTLRDNRTRVEVGTMAPIDIVRAEAEVARNEEAAILAAAQIDLAEDNLRRLIFDPASPDYWTTNIDLTDAAPAPTDMRDVDIEAAVAKALQQRTDLVQQRKSLEATDLNMRFFKNQLLPAVDFYANYGLFYRGGVQFDNRVDPPAVVDETGWGDTLSSMLKRDAPRWTLGFQVSYPLGRSTQEVNLARARLQQTQSQLNLKDSELQAAAEVRNAGRNVNTNRRRVEASRATRILSERQLEAEQKKFAVGLSTSFEVVQAQRDLANARNSELQAIIDYVQALVDFDAVQLAGTTNASASGVNGGNNNGGTGGTNNNQQQNR
jgi:outer membrane protein